MCALHWFCYSSLLPQYWALCLLAPSEGRASLKEQKIYYIMSFLVGLRKYSQWITEMWSERFAN